MNKSSKIDRVGVELEGGWKQNRPQQKHMHGDSSVEIPNYEEFCYDEDGDFDMCGEIASSPFASLHHLSRWIRESYPDTTNASCGLHIHISTKKQEDYALLMHKKFYNIFLVAMEKWGQRHCSSRSSEDRSFWARFKGNNDFCVREHYPISQIKGQDDKYTQLNFCSWREHRTLECRLFPAFKTVDKSISGTAFFIRLVDNYLRTMKPNDYTKKYLQIINPRV